MVEETKGSSRRLRGRRRPRFGDIPYTSPQTPGCVTGICSTAPAAAYFACTLPSAAVVPCALCRPTPAITQNRRKPESSDASQLCGCNPFPGGRFVAPRGAAGNPGENSLKKAPTVWSRCGAVCIVHSPLWCLQTCISPRADTAQGSLGRLTISPGSCSVIQERLLCPSEVVFHVVRRVLCLYGY